MNAHMGKARKLGIRILMEVSIYFRRAFRIPTLYAISIYYVSVLMLSLPHPCAAQGNSRLSPSDVQAAYLYNFGKFVRYPSAQGQDAAPFAICILGEDAFGGTLDSLVANESVQGRRIITRRLTSPAAAANCQIVFIGQSEAPKLEKDLASLEKKPALTVSSLPGFLDHGGMVQFLVENKRVRFAVNLNAASQTGLELSSELLKVAVHVDLKPAQEAK